MPGPGHALQAGALRAEIRPDLGGSLAGLWHGETPLLRSSPAADLSHPRASACFPLVPYSNRLGWRRFDWQGEPFHTAANFPDSPHSLHGTGWLRAWTVLERTAHTLKLGFDQAPDTDWPFAFSAEQTFDLRADGLHLGLRLTNTDGCVQPAGLGWHPYFVRRPDTQVEIPLTHCWDKDPNELPAQRRAMNGLHGVVEPMRWDHCFEGWTGEAGVHDKVVALRLRSNLRWLVVFTPPQRDFFCIEPVSHVNNALNADDPKAQGVVVLEPGGTLSAALSLTLEDCP